MDIVGQTLISRIYISVFFVLFFIMVFKPSDEFSVSVDEHQHKVHGIHLDQFIMFGDSITEVTIHF